MKEKSLGCSILLLVLLIAVMAASCVEGIDTDPKNLIGRWQMVKVIHQGKAISKPNIPDYQHEMEVEFLKNGEIEGMLPTEEFDGDYEISGEDSISITRWKSSKAGVTNWGGYFYDNIQLVKTFSLKKKGLTFKYNELYLNYSDGQLIFDRTK